MKLYTAPENFLIRKNNGVSLDRLSASVAFTGIYEQITEENVNLFLTSTNPLEREVAKIWVSKTALEFREAEEIRNSVYLNNTQITFLPKGLKVCGILDLTNTPVTSLPKGLEVGGDLWLSNTQITSLPKGLKVGGAIFARKNQIKNCPKHLKKKLRILL